MAKFEGKSYIVKRRKDGMVWLETQESMREDFKIVRDSEVEFLIHKVNNNKNQNCNLKKV
jgi:hypothetical protein